MFESLYSALVSWMAHGILNWSWWEVLIYSLIVTHITIASVTIYLHRHQAHRALDLHPLPAHFFRFWLWLTTGMVTKEWAAIHRKHHAKCETEEDPHSPQTYGIETVFWRGAELYRIESRNAETLEKYGHGTPDDWIEHNLYSRFQWQGVALMLIINLALFGALGLTVWAVQMLWIPITAAGIINGIGHYWGYRNYDCADASTNIVPWGILIGGEELHNNHHTFATSAKLSNKWYEFDIGWLYICCLKAVGLAKVKKVAPTPKKMPIARPADIHTLQAVIANRYEVMARYTRTLRRAYIAELVSLKEAAHDFYDSSDWLIKDEAKLHDNERTKLAQLMAQSTSLRVYVEMRRDLSALWGRSHASTEQLLRQLQDWCARAEQSGIQALHDFSLRLRRYT